MTAQRLYAYALRCLTRRDYGITELRRKLLIKFIDDKLNNELINKLTDDTITRLINEQLLNDQRFTENFIKMYQRRGCGSLRIQKALRQKGIDAVLIQSMLDLSTDDWLRLAQQVRHKKYGRELPKDLRQKAQQARFLYQRGFTSTEINQVLQHDDQC